jgi:hypothetical protein
MCDTMVRGSGRYRRRISRSFGTKSNHKIGIHRDGRRWSLSERTTAATAAPPDYREHSRTISAGRYQISSWDDICRDRRDWSRKTAATPDYRSCDGRDDGSGRRESRERSTGAVDGSGRAVDGSGRAVDGSREKTAVAASSAGDARGKIEGGRGKLES